MDNNWPIRALKDLITIKHGFAFKGEFFKDKETYSYLFTPGNFSVGGGFKGSKFKYYDGPVPEDYILDVGDLVVSMTDLSKQADTLGYSALVPEIQDHQLLHNQRVGLVEIISEDIDKGFLYFLLRSNGYRHHVVSGATGTTVKHTSPTKISSYEFQLPPINIQKKISNILISLEDKVSLNQIINQTLEQMAQTLFKSWFVDFDPVIDNLLDAIAQGEARDIPESLATRIAARKALREQDDDSPSNTALPDAVRQLFPSAFEESELGWVPEGWETGSLSEISNVLSGFAFKSKDLLNEKTESKVLKIKNIKSNKTINIEDVQYISQGLAKVSNKYSLSDGDLLMAMTGATVGKIGVVAKKQNERYFLNQRVAKFESKDSSIDFVYSVLRLNSSESYIVNAAQGSAQPNISAKSILELPLIIPCEKLRELYINEVAPMHHRVFENTKANFTLTKLRDTLLPKLISGELRLDSDEVTEAQQAINSH